MPENRQAAIEKLKDAIAKTNDAIDAMTKFRDELLIGLDYEIEQEKMRALAGYVLGGE